MMSVSIITLSFVWFVAFSAYVFLIGAGIYEYQPSFLGCYLYLFGCLLLLMTGVAFGKKYGLKVRTKIKNKSRLSLTYNETFLVNVLCVLSLVGGIFDLINIGGFSGSLEVQRELQVNQEIIRGNMLISYISIIFASLGLIGGCFILSTNQKKSIKTSIIIFYFIGNALYSLTTGGRIHLLAGVLCLIASYLTNLFTFYTPMEYRVYRKSLKKILQKKLPFIIIVFLLGTLFFGFLSYLRAGSSYEVITTNQSTDFYKMTYFINNIPWISELNYQLKVFIGYLLFSTFGGLSDGIYNFQPYFEHYNRSPLFGAYQFNFISVRFPGYDWMSWKKNIEDIYLYAGRIEDNVWGTFVREFITDFGFSGTPFASFLSGFLIGTLEKNSSISKSLYLLYVLSLTWLIMSIFYSFFILRTFQVAFLISFVYAITFKLK